AAGEAEAAVAAQAEARFRPRSPAGTRCRGDKKPRGYSGGTADDAAARAYSRPPLRHDRHEQEHHAGDDAGHRPGVGQPDAERDQAEADVEGVEGEEHGEAGAEGDQDRAARHREGTAGLAGGGVASSTMG